MAIYNPNTMSTSDVKKMQQALVDAGYSVGTSGVDGIWGNDTSAALSAYKAATGGSNTNGKSVGTETFNKLYGTNSGGSSSNKSSGTSKNYVVNSGDTGYNVDLINKAQAYVTGGNYTPGQTYDVNYWAGSSGGKANMYGNNKDYKAQAWTTKDMETVAGLAALYDQQVQQQMLAQQQAQFEAMLAPYQNMEAMYNRMYEQMAAQNAQNTAAAQQRIQQTVDSIKANEGKINDAYAQAQREAYINSVLQGNQMGDYLQAMGYNGGMAESTMGQLTANYENNRRQATSERDNALRQNEQLIAEAQATGNSELADIANNYYNNMVGALQNQAQLNYQIAQDQQAQANADREYQLALQQQQFQQQMHQQQYDDEKSVYKDSQSQTQAEADFNTFLNTYAGKYDKKATYEQWIKNLEAMDDPYGYNKQKIAYLKQYINKNFNNGSAGGGGTPAGTVKESDTTTNIQGSTNDTYKGLNFQVQTMLMNGTTRLLSGKLISQIEEAVYAGEITEQQARALLDMMK